MFEIIKQKLSELYEFRYNKVKVLIEYRLIGTKQYSLADRRAKLTILGRIRESVPSCTMSLLDEIMYSDFSSEVDPFMEYFETLAPWDGVDRIEELARVVDTDDNTFWRVILRKFLYATVKSMLELEFVNQHVLVLIGQQNVGKSTWLNRLVPDSLKQYVHCGPIDPKSKDDVRKLSECMFINLDELDAMGRQNTARLKELISRGTINQRRPYGTDNELFARRASFVASLNNYQFLHDQTGNRRFWCFKAYSIKRGVFVDMDQLYAQVHQELKEGADSQLSIEEVAMVEERNHNFLSLSPVEEAVYGLFDQGSAEDGEFYQATQVAERIKERLAVRQVSHALRTLVGSALSKKYERARKGNLHGYNLRQRETPPFNKVDASN